MMVAEPDTILGRKSARRDPGAGRLQAALQAALTRSARQIDGLTLQVKAIDRHDRVLTELLELPEERALLAVLQGPGDSLGLAVIGPAVLATLVDVQTTGIVAGDAATDRMPTRVDAAMAALWIDSVLSGLAERLPGDQGAAWCGSFRYASFLADARPLGLLLEDVAYRVFSADLSLCEEMRAGRVVFALPQPAGHGAEDGRAAAAAPSDNSTRQDERADTAAIFGAPAVLRAVIARPPMTLEAIMALRPGSVLGVPADALDNVAVEGMDGCAQATARLGQNAGRRALRLTRLGNALDSRAGQTVFSGVFPPAVPVSGPGVKPDEASGAVSQPGFQPDPAAPTRQGALSEAPARAAAAG